MGQVSDQTCCGCNSAEDGKLPRRPIRPFKALSHFRKLLADKEDTEQVFHIIEALNGNSLSHAFDEFLETPYGQARLSERKYLPEMLDDHKRWEALPANTVGAAYLHFMRSQGLTAQGLVNEFDKFADNHTDADWSTDLSWFGDRMRDTHDLFHVLSGYSRDPLGEACVLAFSYSQDKSRGALFIAYMVGLELKKSAPKGAPILKSIREAQKRGKAASLLAREDIEALLHEDLEFARARLGLTPERHYSAVHDRYATAGMDPFEAIAVTA